MPKFPSEGECTMPIRSFVALELSAEVRTNLTNLLRVLQRMPAPIKWVEPENLHLTLKFLGEVPEGQIAAITETLVPSPKRRQISLSP